MLIQEVKRLQQLAGIIKETTGAVNIRGDKGTKRPKKDDFIYKDQKGNILSYIPRTDYRVEGKFNHKEYGVGEIEWVEPKNIPDQHRRGAAYISVKFPGEDGYIKLNSIIRK